MRHLATPIGIWFIKKWIKLFTAWRQKHFSSNPLHTYSRVLSFDHKLMPLPKLTTTIVRICKWKWCNTRELVDKTKEIKRRKAIAALTIITFLLLGFWPDIIHSKLVYNGPPHDHVFSLSFFACNIWYQYNCSYRNRSVLLFDQKSRTTDYFHARSILEELTAIFSFWNSFNNYNVLNIQMFRMRI